MYTVAGKDLKKFYDKHYIPNNASLIVVGDINPEDVFTLAESHFGHLKPNPNYTKNLPPIKPSLQRFTIEQPVSIADHQFALIWQTPGLCKSNPYIIHTVNMLLNQRLDTTLNKEVGRLTTEPLVSANFRLFEGDVLCIFGGTGTKQNRNKLIELVKKEIDSIAAHGCTLDEVATIQRLIKMDEMSTLESISQQAYEIGKHFWSRGDAAYPFTDHNVDPKTLEKELRSFATKYLANGTMHSLLLVPLTDATKEIWQEASKKDQVENEIILKHRVRTCSLEETKYAKKLQITDPETREYPAPSVITLPNGLTILYHHAPTIPLVHCTLDFKASTAHEEEPGLMKLLFKQLESDGSIKKSPQKMLRTLDRNGISFDGTPGQFNFTCLAEQLPTALALLNEKIRQPRFSAHILQSQKESLIALTQQCKKEATFVANAALRNLIFSKDHWPMGPIAYIDKINKLTIKQLKKLYKKYITPRETVLCIVGDLTNIEVPALVKSLFAQWKGPRIPDVPNNTLSKQAAQEKIYCLPAKEVVLLMSTTAKIDLNNPAWHSLCIADGLMQGALFNIRQQTGAFYHCEANLATLTPLDSPRCSSIGCIVSPQQFNFVKDAFTKCLRSLADNITQEDLITQRRNVIHSYNYLYETNGTMAHTFVSLYRHKLPFDFYTQSTEHLKKRTLTEIKNDLKNILNPEHLHIVAAGPCEDIEKRTYNNSK